MRVERLMTFLLIFALTMKILPFRLKPWSDEERQQFGLPLGGRDRTRSSQTVPTEAQTYP